MPNTKPRDDEVAFFTEASEDLTRIRVTFISGRKVSLDEFKQALEIYIEDLESCAGEVFDFAVVFEEKEMH